MGHLRDVMLRPYGAEEVLALAARRFSEEARAVRALAHGTPNGAFLARAGDLVRSQWFLWARATLATGERLGRATPGSRPSWRPISTPWKPSSSWSQASSRRSS